MAGNENIILRVNCIRTFYDQFVYKYTVQVWELIKIVETNNIIRVYSIVSLQCRCIVKYHYNEGVLHSSIIMRVYCMVVL